MAALPFPIGSAIDFIRVDGSRATGTVEARRLGTSVAHLTLRLGDGALADVVAWGNAVTEFGRAGEFLLTGFDRAAGQVQR